MLLSAVVEFAATGCSIWFSPIYCFGCNHHQPATPLHMHYTNTPKTIRQKSNVSRRIIMVLRCYPTLNHLDITPKLTVFTRSPFFSLFLSPGCFPVFFLLLLLCLNSSMQSCSYNFPSSFFFYTFVASTIAFVYRRFFFLLRFKHNLFHSNYLNIFNFYVMAHFDGKFHPVLFFFFFERIL